MIDTNEYDIKENEYAVPGYGILTEQAIREEFGEDTKVYYKGRIVSLRELQTTD